MDQYLNRERDKVDGMPLVNEASPAGIAQDGMASLTYTDRFLSSLMALISIFRLPIAVVVLCINRES